MRRLWLALALSLVPIAPALAADDQDPNSGHSTSTYGRHSPQDQGLQWWVPTFQAPGGPRPAATPGSDTAFPAGSAFGAPVGNRDLTRWEAAKDTIRRVLQAYTSQDIMQFMDRFTLDTAQDLGILRNAVLNDYQVETGLAVDIILLQYWVNFDRICTRATWKRNAVRIATGTPINEDGEGIYCFSRHDDFRLRLMFGSLPFGRSDKELQKQLRAGAPNGAPGSSPVDAEPLPLALNLDFQPTGQGNVAMVDFERLGNPVRKVKDPNPSTVPAQPGEDLRISVPLGTFPTQIQVEAFSPALVGTCGSTANADLEDVKRVHPSGLGSSGSTNQGKNFGVLTIEGNRAVLRIPDLGISSYFLSSADLVNPAGTLDCP